jgi:adenosylcobinamide kinase/adenosylcobinamide-phosphate guanylyltransferase
MSIPRVTLVLGGARSGKSAFAEQLVGASEKPIYFATAEASDEEMIERIRRHRARRAARWITVEEPLELVSSLSQHVSPQSAVLVDCLTVWLGNLIHAGRNIDTETNALVELLPTLGGGVVFVSNEVGMGIVPENKMARDFRDQAGRLHQALAARADSVYLVVAGIATTLKGNAL